MKNKISFLTLTILFSFTLYASPSFAQKLVKTELIIDGLYNVFSPSIIKYSGSARMWMGGWLTQAEIGPDKIYFSTFRNGAWSAPQPLVWNPHPNNSLIAVNNIIVNGAKPGYLINDPSVIAPKPNQLFLYYTGLPVNYRDWTDHVVGLAVSSDGGATWWDKGFILNTPGGVWSPCAIVVGNQIWIYYNTGEPGIPLFRQRLEMDGVTLIGGPERVTIEDGTYVSNLDVSRFNSTYVMVANTSDLKNIVKYESTDGLYFRTSPKDTNPIIVSATQMVTTPHLQPVDSKRYKISFAYSFPNEYRFDTIHEWTFEDTH